MSPDAATKPSGSTSWSAVLGNWLNTFLMLDTLLVFLSFAWLVVAVIGDRSGIPLGWNLWQSLWQPLFTPAIGILMAGALVSGILSWAQRKLAEYRERT